MPNTIRALTAAVRMAIENVAAAARRFIRFTSLPRKHEVPRKTPVAMVRGKSVKGAQWSYGLYGT
jgi:hypothetical protein